VAFSTTSFQVFFDLPIFNSWTTSNNGGQNKMENKLEQKLNSAYETKIYGIRTQPGITNLEETDWHYRAQQTKKAKYAHKNHYN